MSDTIRSRGLLEGDTEKGFLGAQFSLEQDENMRPGLKPVSVIVLGAGERGKIYADYALTHPDRIKVVGVAEPRRRQRMNMVEAHRIPDENIFEDWAAVFKRERFADAVIITTPDRLHASPTLSAAEKGYHILLEKPMAPTEEECRAIVTTVMEKGVIFSVCHVLRHTNYTRA